MSGVAIRTNELGKRYTLGTHAHGYGTLRESIVRAVKRPLRVREEKESAQTHWALKALSLSIPEGEVVGLIGHNGAGKTTLLKILSRITEPTTGWAEVAGRVGSLLEVGTGFHPELTGRENVFLNGSILGMRRAEIRRRFDEIVDFADVERFLDTPVKRYSSGMSVRLAFAVAAHLETEILLVDEVLAVGDAEFQRRSLGKMDEVAKQGRTVIFVSHNLAVIQALCQRAVLLELGAAVADGPVRETIDQYLRGLERAASDDLLARVDRDGRGYDETLVQRLEIRNPDGGSPDILVAGRPATISVQVTKAIPGMHCRLTILNSLGQPVTSLDSAVPAPTDVRDADLGTRLECEIPSLPLLPGRYRIDVLLTANRVIQDGLQAAAFFDVEPGVLAGRPIPATGSDGTIALAHTWRLPG
jgi:lipopolysaccharide transport system ATP-binding protein